MMLGFATATMVESTKIMKKPTIIAYSAFQGFAQFARFPCPCAVAHRMPPPALT
jgi:hypothetical protein